jgi:hypothetical protein
MAAVFDRPVSPVCGKHLLRVGLSRSLAGDAIGDFTGVFTGLFICELALDDKSLPNVRKIQIVIKFGCGPDFTDFNSAVIRRIEKEKIGIFAIFEVYGNVLKNTGLVVFDRKMVMSVTLQDQIVGDISLGQKGIGGNFFTLDIDGIK